MNLVIDSSIWLEYLTEGPRIKKVEHCFRAPHQIILPVIVVYEVYKKIKAERGEAEAVFVAAQLERLAHRVMEVCLADAIHAADASVHYRMPMADAFVYTSALAADAVVVTMDAHFRGLPKVQFIAERTSSL